MKPHFFYLIAAIILSALASESISAQPIFTDASRSNRERAEDIVKHMTLPEKVSLMVYNSPAVERLGIRNYNWWNEALHGIARNGNATVFPMPIAMASSFDTELLEQVFTATSDEGRIKWNIARTTNEKDMWYKGLSYWTPNINIFRDPRWGRGMETYGEDPYLTSQMGMAVVRGLQGEHKDGLIKALACAKHYAIHSGPESKRHSFDAVVSERDLWETYLPAFKDLVIKADVKQVMFAYNRMFGVPAGANERFMRDILEKEWGFEGVVVSDCWAVADFYSGHKWSADKAEAAAAAVKAGMDMAIVNPSMLQIYDEIEPELLKCVEDVIFDSDPQATERLTEKASAMLAAKDTASAATNPAEAADHKHNASVSERLAEHLLKGRTEGLEELLHEAMDEYGQAVKIIEGPLMEGMENVGRMFGEGKMFLPQVVKAARVMKDAVGILEPFMSSAMTDEAAGNNDRRQPSVVIATVKGDVHDIGKNITGIVLSCNGFKVHDLGVMVGKEVILDEAARLDADIIAVSGLITPSLYQMEELCREMAARGMDKPLMIGGATTSALHTAVKLAPLYSHVFYGADASAAAVNAKRYMMDPEAFENEQKLMQEELRNRYNSKKETREETALEAKPTGEIFAADTYLTLCPSDMPAMEVPASDILPFFDWKLFYAIWGVKYGSAAPEAMELMQLRRDAEEEIAAGDFRIMLTVRFHKGESDGTGIYFRHEGAEVSIPMLREENGRGRSLCDYVARKGSGVKTPFGMFAISVSKASKAHEEGCCCPACSNRYEDMIGKTVRMTLAEAASCWLDRKIMGSPDIKEGFKLIKPAAGYASCPDHTLKGEILEYLGECGKPHHHHAHHGHDCRCGHKHGPLGISLTDSYAMTPEASICGLVFIHPEAGYPDIRAIGKEQYDSYSKLRGFDSDKARRFLGNLLK